MSPADKKTRYTKSNALLERALKVIPLGSQTFSKSYTQFPAGLSPLFLTQGRGGRVWDVDGNEYVDMICALLPVVLGYQDKDVDRAIQEQLKKGISFSLATELEVELAERLVEIIPCAEMVRYGKNGSDATSATVRLARAVTGRDRIAAGGYHGWHDWYVGATVRNRGIPEAVGRLTHKFPYNDIRALHQLFKDHPGEFAAVIMEPMNVSEPYPGYLQEVRDLAHEHGALLIFDEIITGFRYALGGAQEYFGVVPDLAAFGKSMGNGMPISAVLGKAEYMRVMEEVFVSFTFGGEALSLAASIAVIDKMRREPVIETLWKTGKTLADGIGKLLRENGLEKEIVLGGLPPWTILNFNAHGSTDKDVIKTFFIRSMLEQGILMHTNHNVCYAHTEKDIRKVLDAYEKVLPLIREGLSEGDLEKQLACPVIRPVFYVR